MTAPTQSKAVVIYSGGMDSFTVLHQALNNRVQLYPLTFDYGQRHAKEIVFAQQVCKTLNLPSKVLDIRAINQLMTSSSLTQTDISIPEGGYADANMQSTVVPNRNMILLSLAIGYAVDIGAQEVYYGAHSGDHAIYPDCRPEFVEAMNQVSSIANYEPVAIRTPFLSHSKADILKVGLQMGLDYSQTWTCYNGRERACGKCGACIERLKAFSENNAQDPLSYESKT